MHPYSTLLQEFNAFEVFECFSRVAKFIALYKTSSLYITLNLNFLSPFAQNQTVSNPISITFKRKGPS